MKRDHTAERKAHLLLAESTTVELEPDRELPDEIAVLLRFHLRAGIAAIHAGALDSATIDWSQILSLYDHMFARWPSPIVALNRSVAVLHVRGADEAERALASVQSDPSLASYALLHGVAAEFARKKGDLVKAARLLDRALACPCSEPQRRFLERRRYVLDLRENGND